MEAQQLEENKNQAVLSSDIEEQTHENNDKQIVLYNPPTTYNDDVNTCTAIVPVSDQVSEPVSDQPLVLPSVGAFTVQCAMCYKWRFIPSKEKYEEIREHIMEQPFICDLAREWRDDISCDDPTDIEQDESRLWVIDKPSIAQPPPGWERELRIRGKGCYNFADVYYKSPTGKMLRSIVDVGKYLMKHPEFTSQGVTLSQFSFKTPKPLQEDYVRKPNYVKKPTARLNPSSDEPVQVKKRAGSSSKHMLSLTSSAASDSLHNELQLTVDSMTDNVFPPVKKKARPSSKQLLRLTSSEASNSMHNEHQLPLELMADDHFISEKEGPGILEAHP